jgi:hypothetical protein
MRMLAAAFAAVTALPVAAADPAVQPLPANTRALANDIAGKVTGEQKAWAAEAGRRRPLPGYEALKAEVRSRFATRVRMSALDVDRLAFLALVEGFDDGTAQHARRTAVLHIPTPTPPPSHLAQPGAGLKQPASAVSQGADIQMIDIQSLVSQRQQAMQLTTQIMGATDGTSRTIAANVGR